MIESTNKVPSNNSTTQNRDKDSKIVGASQTSQNAKRAGRGEKPRREFGSDCDNHKMKTRHA